MKRHLLLIALVACAWSARAQGEEGVRLLRAKKYGEALASFEQYLDTARRADNLVTFNAAVCATRVGNHAAAEKYFTRSIASGYNLFAAYTGKANALKQQGKTDEMVETLKAGMKAGTKADSSSRAPLERMYALHLLAEGREHFRANKITKAAESYTLLTRLNDKRWRADGFLSLGTLYAANGSAIMQDASAARGTTLEAARKRAAAEYVKARTNLDRAAALSPDDPRVEEALTRLARLRQDLPPAR